jgi:hormone-sensitive lipase
MEETRIMNALQKKPLADTVIENLNLVIKIRAAKFPFQDGVSEFSFIRVTEALQKFETQLQSLKHLLEDRLQESKDCYDLDLQCKSHISTEIAVHFIEFIAEHLLTHTHQAISDLQVSSICDEALNSLRILAPKLEAAIKFFPMAVKYDPTDMFYYSKESENWKDLDSYVEYLEFNSESELKKSFSKFLGIVYTGNAMIQYGEQHKEKGTIVKNIAKYLSGAYYFFAKEKAKKATHLFYSKPDHTAFEVWNILTQKHLLSAFELTMTPIKVNQLIYVPKQYPSVTLELVDKALESGSWKSVSAPFFNPSDSFPLSSAEKSSINDISKYDEDKIQIRIISNEELSSPSNSKGLFSFLKKKQSKKTLDTLVIHIHGGGWVSMSSGTHQIFLRNWAKQLGVPIFSIDYKLSPEYKYPTALNDCWQAYNWLLDNAQQAFGILPNKIVVVGDSAGANMCLGLSNLAIKSKRRVPDGLFLAYPALNLQTNTYSPSLLKALNDEVVPYSFLELCLNSYLPHEKYASMDPLVSPILASEEFLKQLPAIRIAVGDEDPLHDDCWRFLDKLIKVGKDAKLTIFKGFMHGMLNYDMPLLGMAESQECIKSCAHGIQELLNLVPTEAGGV